MTSTTQGRVNAAPPGHDKPQAPLDAVALLMRRGQDFLGESSAPQRVLVRQSATAILAELHYAQQVHRLVLKSTRGLSAQQLVYASNAVARISPEAAGYFAQIRGVDEDAGLTVFEHVDGSIFLSDLQKDARQPSGGAAQHAVLRRIAWVMAQVHRIRAADAGLGMAPVANQHFLSTFNEWSASFRPPFARRGFADSARFVERLSPGFASRMGDRLLVLDSQPKNVIVRPDGSPCFIDLDWISGPPAMAVALFLVSIDRFAAWYPGDRIQVRVSSWKRSFVEAYREYGEDSDIEDLLLFYPWALMQTCRRHSRLRRWLGPYIRWHYARPLAQFLNSLGGTSIASATRNPGMLFDHGT